MTKKKSFRKLLAAAFALTLVGGLGAGGAANATPTGTAPWAPGAPTTGSIKITKTDDKNGGAPVKGAGFTVTQVTKIGNDDVNTTSYEGWETIYKNVDAMNKGTATAVTTGTVHSEQKTGDNGETTFSNLPLGLYQVEETTIPAGYTVDVKKFYMTVPEITGTDSTNLTYNYDVTVNPKNVDVTGNVTKSDPSGSVVGAGADTSYTVTAKLNKSKGTEQGAKDLTAADIKSFAIFDDVQLDAFVDPTADVVGDVKAGDTKLTLGDDYTVSVTADPAGSGYTNGTRKRVQVTFTEAGLGKIAAEANKAGNEGKNIPVTAVFNLKLKDDLSGVMKDSKGNVVVVNKFGFIPGYGDGENPTVPVVPNPGDPDPDNPGPSNPTMRFGDFQIEKIDAIDSAPLQGAEFIAFANEADANNCVKSDDRSNCSGVAAEYGTKTTGADGKTEGYKAKAGMEFYVVEKKAPSGYILSGKVTHVTVKPGTSVYSITNVRTKGSGTWFNLPRTGAIGVGIFALLGAGLVAGGTAMHMRSRRREDA
ncbi:SpaH/EbpB family LPXTG-anchored major pilin [Actinotignum urinale]|uniref:SpaH/EbpB family LPXTG-anchored major pilin n=1 Tax=Actinotignum urinale TaxID=190146 RepID=A0ABU5G6N7_9ACTO|nr:SpaH/EbpB family LPXTG-anchored major pilin [Actinotignum urinale]MDY5133011.1 SpaH/EbpB family LPXTG-anchored major pilin [Actinotignum urinale]